MRIPESNHLPVYHLASCFNNTTATYKFYWLISILQEVETGNYIIPKRNLFARMISNSWYTVNYFNVSFGKLDLIQNTVRKIKEIEKIPIDEKQQKVFSHLTASKNYDTEKLLRHFNRNVPHRFLSPWFIKKSEKYINAASKSFDKQCIYALYDDIIEVNPDWINYLTSNSKILKDFCYWNLSLFLQARNFSVPDIPNKLIKPPSRGNLENQKKFFWDIALQELGLIKCIYTGKNLTIGTYAMEHFIPHSFVSHDLIWNLIPADPSFNSSKNNRLPPLETYFVPFFSLQKTAVKIVQIKSPNSRFLLDYLTVLPDIENSFTENRFKEIFQPLVTIASNNGFEFLK
jgi:hypothetical protein